MKSIRTKMTLVTIIAIAASISVAALLGVTAIKDVGTNDARQTLILLCECGQKNLDAYFASVEQSVGMVSGYVEEDLENLPDERIDEHLERVREIFARAADKTTGALTYYYRLDPEVFPDSPGFWYVATKDKEGFTEHANTDISLYDTDDTSQLVWFTIPKNKPGPTWQTPYITDNLDERVISYSAPVYKDGRFIGVIGIEIDYVTLAEQVDNITLYDHGYAFVDDSEGNLVYHPHIDAFSAETSLADLSLTSQSKTTFYTFTFQGVKKQACWLPLTNGMRLNVCVPVDEINKVWTTWVRDISFLFCILMVVFAFITLRVTSTITHPLIKLTELAKRASEGDYTVMEVSNADREVSILAEAFNTLVKHLEAYIGDLYVKAYADALTSVKNKGAFSLALHELDEKIGDPEVEPVFGIAIFDCDGLKKVNDEYGHTKGDEYLRLASGLICQVFDGCPVYRIGGDEFAVILEGESSKAAETLRDRFQEVSGSINQTTDEPWRQVHTSVGVTHFIAGFDECADDVVRRADKLMYENKRLRKAERA